MLFELDKENKFAVATLDNDALVEDSPAFGK